MIVSATISGDVDRTSAECWKGVRGNTVRSRWCGGWVYNSCSGVKDILSTTKDALVCKICERADSGEDINIQKSIDPRNGVSRQSWKVLLSWEYPEWS